MKKKLFASIFCSLGLAAMVLPACSNSQVDNEEEELTIADPIDNYVDKSETTVKFEDMKVYAPKEATYELPTKINLTYLNDDGRCASRRFYTWVEGTEDPKALENPNTTTSDTKITLEMDLTTERFSPYAGVDTLWIIMKFGGTWAGQSENTPIYLTNYLDKYEDDGVLDLWVMSGEGTALEIYDNENDTKITKIKTAKFTDWKTIHCVSSEGDVGPVEYRLYAFDRIYLASDETNQISNKEFYLLKKSSGPVSTPEFDIKLNYTAKINVQYMIESVYPGFEDKTPRKVFVTYEELFKTTEFNKYYTYSGEDLGVTYTKERTTFKVWSPISGLITLRLFREGLPASSGGSDTGRSTDMFYTGKGIWECTIEGDLTKTGYRYYNYIVTNTAGNNMEVTDPYAHAVGVNGLRGYIYDPASEEANPSEWNSVPSVWNGKSGYDIANPNDLSIYEIHVRDLTMDETWVSNQGNARGTYNAFVESGTTYSEEFKGTNYEVSTGFDHIKSLGVRAVQLLPVFDSQNEERPTTDNGKHGKYEFNWGYNPLNYNCVEGAYSSAPVNPMARIVEFKNLIKQFADLPSHMRVIMDVVYNHVNSAPTSCFTKLMPKYYFRYTKDWAYTNGSGCSNDVRTEAPMMRKYIVDSLKWWATEYKIKGFRFDLMGLIDVETMRQVRNALTAIDPDIYIYGEGWTSGGTNFDTGAVGATDSNVYSMLYPSSETKGYVGAFNDEGRNAIRGKHESGWSKVGNKYPQWGFAQSGKADMGGYLGPVYDMLKGYHSGKGGNPNQSISYASCHDNYTVWDQLRYQLATNGYSEQDEMGTGYEYEKPLRPKSGGEPDISELVAASKMIHGIVAASNGVAFIQGGEEIYRTKTIAGSDNPAQGYKKTPEFKKLTEGGDEALLRAFPQYMNYDPKNNPEDPEYDPNAPISVLCTGEVRMYKDDEYVSHNSYNLPDSVNCFKWDRKIHIGETLTYEEPNNYSWAKMFELRNKTAKYDYDQMTTGKKAEGFSQWGEYWSNGGLGIYIPNGIHLVMACAEGGELGIGNQTFYYSSKGPSDYSDHNTLHMFRYSLFVYALGIN